MTITLIVSDVLFLFSLLLFLQTKQRELNDKMDLASYLLKPVQRMGKYALLLQQLVKACSTVEVHFFINVHSTQISFLSLSFFLTLL